MSGLFISLIGVTPANAAPTVALSVNGVAFTTANVSTTPVVITVPSDNSVDALDALRFYLTGITPGTAVVVTAQNALIVPALSTSLNAVKSTAGVATGNYSVGTGTTYEFFAYTKSTALGTITITNDGSTFTYYLKGSSGPVYTIAYTAQAKPYTSTIIKQSAKITDVFGNAVSGVIPTLALINLTSTVPTASDANGVSEFTLTYPGTPGRSALSVTIPAIDVSGLSASVKSVSTFIDVVDAADEITAVAAARAADKVAADAALAAEKAARTADKVAADAAKATEKAATDKALAAEKAARTADKVAADADKVAADAAKATEKAATDAALAAEKAARTADKVANDKSIATLNTKVAALTKQIADLKALYNKLALKFKQKTIK